MRRSILLRRRRYSRAVLENVVRGEIGFDGLLMTDDLSMKALEGTFFERAARAFAAGVDLVLHCNGDLAEAGAVAQAAPVLAGGSLERVERAREAVKVAVAAAERAAAPFDPVEARAELFAALAAFA